MCTIAKGLCCLQKAPHMQQVMVISWRTFSTVGTVHQNPGSKKTP